MFKVFINAAICEDEISDHVNITVLTHEVRVEVIVNHFIESFCSNLGIKVHTKLKKIKKCNKFLNSW